MDRAHRLGQTKQVTVYRLITKDTVDERIVQLARCVMFSQPSFPCSSSPPFSNQEQEARPRRRRRLFFRHAQRRRLRQDERGRFSPSRRGRARGRTSTSRAQAQEGRGEGDRGRSSWSQDARGEQEAEGARDDCRGRGGGEEEGCWGFFLGGRRGRCVLSSALGSSYRSGADGLATNQMLSPSSRTLRTVERPTTTMVSPSMAPIRPSRSLRGSARRRSTLESPRSPNPRPRGRRERRRNSWRRRLRRRSCREEWGRRLCRIAEYFYRCSCAGFATDVWLVREGRRKRIGWLAACPPRTFLFRRHHFDLSVGALLGLCPLVLLPTHCNWTVHQARSPPHPQRRHRSLPSQAR